MTSLSSSRPAAGGTSFAHVLRCLALLWIAGNGMRLTILAVPPVIPFIHDDLHMSETQVGILSGLPAMLFAFAAVPGSLLIARFGALTALIVGLLATAAGSALRGAADGVALLYATTILTGFGVAVMQPAMPPLVRTWLPDRIGFATAVYTNGLLIGEVLPVALTGVLVLPLVGSWRADFVVWGACCAAIALVIALLAPRSAAPAPLTAPRKWWPDWRSGLIWRLGLMLGSVNALYFTTNFFIPNYLRTNGHAADIDAALTAINVGQLPASLLLLFVAGRLIRQRWPYFVCAVLCFIAVLCVVYGGSFLIITGASLIGFAAAVVLILMLALPPLLSPPDDVHRTAAAMFTISYTCAVVVPVLSGICWDMTGVPAAAFIPIGLCAVVLGAGSLKLAIRPSQA
jgi:CP family cyanate transporter-like MFS transporter